MDSSKLEQFKALYNNFRNTEAYQTRKEQAAIVPVLRDIIWETLKNSSLDSSHLTGLIQMFKNNASNESFDRYLKANIPDKERREVLSERAYDIGLNGYTNAGKAAISALPKIQLEVVRNFLLEAFNIITVEAAVKLCEEYDSKRIPEVKKGVYSPWLYYINPEIFPIINNVHTNFLQWIDITPKYPVCIEAFSQLKNLVNEKDLGLLDWFAYDFESESITDTSINTLNLAGKKLFKISHGIFKWSEFKDNGIWQVLEKRNWISLADDTGKNQYNNFKDYAAIGDYVYICYGGNALYGIGRIISETIKYDEETARLVKGQDKWVYREIELLFSPSISTVTELKAERKGFMPSANTTFMEVPKNQLDYINEKIFIPKFNLKIIDEMEKGEGTTNNGGNKGNELDSKNIILYGPPGTGKTFQSINYAVALVENKLTEELEKEDRKKIKQRFNDYIKSGQIILTTFHQSMGYEDFIEGIKPKVDEEDEDNPLFYEYKDGIFKKLCTEAAFSFVKQNATPETEKVLGFSEQYDRYIEILLEEIAKNGLADVPTKNGGKIIVQAITKNKNIEFIHPNGKREYIVSKSRLSQVSQAFPDINSLTNIYEQIRDVIGGMNSTGYWAVLNAIRNQPAIPVSSDQKERPKEYSYEDKKDAVQTLTNEDYKKFNSKKYVIIIDEINRGNVSQVFGELITLIEDDKRAGMDEALTAVLPYSEESFSVPPNLYVIGTMNTADRSVEALDTALRRRFSFIPVLPDADKLPVKMTSEGINLPELLKSLNDRLTILKDKDHTIGHAWLWNVSNLQQLRTAYANKILPLLLEFFYNDYEKLGLVLGDSFFEPYSKVNQKVFAKFSGGNGLADQYDDRYQYKLKSHEVLSVADFQSLYLTKSLATPDEQ